MAGHRMRSSGTPRAIAASATGDGGGKAGLGPAATAGTTGLAHHRVHLELGVGGRRGVEERLERGRRHLGGAEEHEATPSDGGGGERGGGGSSAGRARAVTAPRRFEATRGDETASRAVARVDDDDENEHDPRVRKIRPRLAGATRRVAAAA